MLLQYIGTSFFPSKLIMWFSTWGLKRYSHSAWSFCEIKDGMLVGDTSEYEAWQRGGVSHVPEIGFNHTKGTRIDLYVLDDPLTNEEANKGLEFLTAQLHKKYDYHGIIGFLLRRKFDRDDRWFCSELVFAFLIACGRVLLRNIAPYQVSPQILPMCPEFTYVGYIISGEGFKVRQDEKEV